MIVVAHWAPRWPCWQLWAMAPARPLQKGANPPAKNAFGLRANGRWSAVCGAQKSDKRWRAAPPWRWVFGHPAIGWAFVCAAMGRAGCAVVLLWLSGRHCRLRSEDQIRWPTRFQASIGGSRLVLKRERCHTRSKNSTATVLNARAPAIQKAAGLSIAGTAPMPE